MGRKVYLNETSLKSIIKGVLNEMINTDDTPQINVEDCAINYNPRVRLNNTSRMEFLSNKRNLLVKCHRSVKNKEMFAEFGRTAGGGNCWDVVIYQANKYGAFVRVGGCQDAYNTKKELIQAAIDKDLLGYKCFSNAGIELRDGLQNLQNAIREQSIFGANYAKDMIMKAPQNKRLEVAKSIVNGDYQETIAKWTDVKLIGAVYQGMIRYAKKFVELASNTPTSEGETSDVEQNKEPLN